MQIVQDLNEGNSTIKRIPLYGGGTDIALGAAVIRGATPGTNTGYGIVGVPSYAGFIGCTEALFQASVTDNDPTAGTKYILTPVILAVKPVYSIDYDAVTTSAGLTIASMSATPGNPTISSLEAVDGGWLLGSDGFLTYIESVSGGAATVKNAAPWTAGVQKVLRIFPRWHQLADLNTAATNFKITTAAAGTGAICVVENYIRATGYDRILLDPTKHSGITFQSPTPYSYTVFRTVAA